MKQTEIIKAVAEMWNKLSVEDKRPFE